MTRPASSIGPEDRVDVRNQIAYRDAYARTVEARVADVDASGEAPLVVLDRTIFYPGGGG